MIKIHSNKTPVWLYQVLPLQQLRFQAIAHQFSQSKKFKKLKNMNKNLTKLNNVLMKM